MPRFDLPGDIDIRVNGNLSARSMTFPVGQITDDAVNASAAIKATKVIHQHALRYPQPGGTAVVAATVPLHTFRGAAEIVAVDVVPIVAPTGGDLAYSVDVQLGSAGSAFASILSAPETVDSSSADRTPQAAGLSTLAAADGETLQVVVATSGSTGTQGQGLIVTVWIREEP